MRKEIWTRREMLALGGASLIASASPSRPLHEASYRDTVLAAKPAGYWRLGETQGTTARDATDTHNGRYHGPVVFGETGAIRGDQDTAVRLNGRDSFAEVPNNRVFSQPTSKKGLTVEVWMRPDILIFDSNESGPYVHWLGKGDRGQNEWGFRFYSRHSDRPNRISAYIWNLGGDLGAGAYFQDRLKPREWIHIVACYSPGTMDDPAAGVSIYKNGLLRGGPDSHPPQPGARYAQYNITPEHGTAPVRFGTRDLKSFFQGGLDEIAIYPRVLTNTEIMEHYRAGSRAGS
jgi:hypothetical protein